jgi:peptidoglycan/LPS O-acetylase OafA/YrhL
LFLGSPRYLPLESFFLVFFFLGLVLRMAVVDGDVRARRWAMVLVPAITLGTLVHGGGFFPVPVNANPYLRALPVISGTLGAVLFFLAVLRWKPRFSSLFMYFGTISYSVYLFQDVALHLLPRWMPVAAHPAAFCLAVLGMTVVLAALVYAFVEKPMLELGRRITARSSQPATAPLAA